MGRWTVNHELVTLMSNISFSTVLSRRGYTWDDESRWWPAFLQSDRRAWAKVVRLKKLEQAVEYRNSSAYHGPSTWWQRTRTRWTSLSSSTSLDDDEWRDHWRVKWPNANPFIFCQHFCTVDRAICGLLTRGRAEKLCLCNLITFARLEPWRSVILRSHVSHRCCEGWRESITAHNSRKVAVAFRFWRLFNPRRCDEKDTLFTLLALMNSTTWVKTPEYTL